MVESSKMSGKKVSLHCKCIKILKSSSSLILINIICNENDDDDDDDDNFILNIPFLVSEMTCSGYCWLLLAPEITWFFSVLA